MKQGLSHEKFLKILSIFLVETKEGMVIIDTHSEERPIIYANIGFTKMTGFTENEVIGKDLSFLFGQETSREKIAQIELSFKNKDNGTIIVLNYKKDGSKFWNLFSISPIHNSRGINTHLMVIFKNVTDQRNLTKQKAEFDSMKATLETVNDIIFNYMNYLIWFREEMEEHFIQEGNEEGVTKLKTFDFELKNVLKRLMTMNELKEYKEKYITHDLTVLLNDSPNENKI